MTSNPESVPDESVSDESVSDEPVSDEGVDTGPLEHAQEKIDDAKDAVHDAMKDSAPAADLEVPGAGADAESGDGENVTPRPN